ncbi:polysaccharide lyase 6 family protein [Thalassotalea litorea]|uniref:polysaccharide lyase 6 family protein n=1 Tax=Thalassotalea litorea TaxID=2020715 RepID=UPI00373593EE
MGHMSKLVKAFLPLVAISLPLMSNMVAAKQFKVSSQEQYSKTLKQVEPGDTIVLADKVWKDFEIVFKAKGTKAKPITLTAETSGKAILTGNSNLRLAGEHLIVKGLVFKDGYSPTGEVISFRRNKDDLANHSRVTEVVIDHYSNPDKFESDKWVVMYGKHNRFDHSHLVGKSNAGVTMAVRLNTEDSQQNHHRIDHNYFGPRPILGSNGGETLRIGTSHYSLTDSFTIVENNYFDRCNGEVEIISNKSGKNEFRGNVFFESRGTLTLRHGSGNLVEDNIFFGNGVDHTGGIRVINGDQTIRNNYLQGLTGYRFGSGFTVMNGVIDSPINRYHQVENARIENNTMINVDHIHLAAGSDKERQAVPVDSVFANNLIVNETDKDNFSVFDDVSGIEFNNNIRSNVDNPALTKGFEQQSIELSEADNGLMYAKNAPQSVGVSKDLKVLDKEQTGVSWYAKPGRELDFDQGSTHTVKNASELYDAIEQAQSSDVIALEAGEYILDKIIPLSKTLTFKSASKDAQASLKVSRSTTFDIHDGGNLKLQNLSIDGEYAPDSAGNAIIRTSKIPMLANYRFIADQVQVSGLDINHSFHFFDAGNRSFANDIRITNSSFRKITGDILRLDKEMDDLGIYNGEYITLNDNVFESVQGALVKLYRGGTDESTFGPHFSFNNNQVISTGKGKRNKYKASLYLHGVQVSDVQENEFLDSAGLVVEHTVGEPQTLVKSNNFIATPKIVVKELNFPGEITATLIDNNYQAAAKK